MYTVTFKTRLQHKHKVSYHEWLSRSSSLFYCICSLSVSYSSFFVFSMNNFLCMQLPKNWLELHFSPQKASCPSLQWIHLVKSSTPLQLHMLFFCFVKSPCNYYCKPSVRRENTLSSSLHQQPPMYTVLILCFSQHIDHIAHTKQSLRVFCSLSTLPVRFSTLLNSNLSGLQAGRRNNNSSTLT